MRATSLIRPTCIAVLLFVLGVPAFAGPNAGGVLLLHAHPTLQFTSPGTDYCGESGVLRYSDAETMVEGQEPHILFVLAAFETYAPDPRVLGVTFGISYDASRLALLDYGTCGDFELSTPDWPASRSGTAVTFSIVKTSPLFEVYWFAAYNEADRRQIFCLDPHPFLGAGFADDAIPANIDPIYYQGLGCIGFDTQGWNPAGIHTDESEPCCLDGDCILATWDWCHMMGGAFPATPHCSPNECEEIGACCLISGCEQLTPSSCANRGGLHLGAAVACDSANCDTPVRPLSWGSIKTRY